MAEMTIEKSGERTSEKEQKSSSPAQRLEDDELEEALAESLQATPQLLGSTAPTREPKLTLKTKEVRQALGKDAKLKAAVEKDPLVARQYLLDFEDAVARKKESKQAYKAEAKNRPAFEQKTLADYFKGSTKGVKVHLTTAGPGVISSMKPMSHWFELDEVKRFRIVHIQQAGILKEAQGYTDGFTPNRVKGFVYYDGGGFQAGSETNPVGKEYQNTEAIVPTGYISLL